MLDLDEIGVSYYEIGGEIQTCRVSNATTVLATPSSVDTVSTDRELRNSPYDVCYAAGEQRHLPYSMGNPLINLGFNILLRGIETAGLVPEEELPYD